MCAAAAVHSRSHVWFFATPPGSYACQIFQARILEWVVMSFSRGSSQPKDPTCVSCLGRWILYHWTPIIVVCSASCTHTKILHVVYNKYLFVFIFPLPGIVNIFWQGQFQSSAACWNRVVDVDCLTKLWIVTQLFNLLWNDSFME